MSDVVTNTDTPIISDSTQNRIGFQTSKHAEEADIIISRPLCMEEEKELDQKNDHCVRGRGICASDCIRPEQMQHELQNVLGESSSYHKWSDCEGHTSSDIKKLFENNVEFPADFFHGEENVNNNAAESLQIVCRGDLSEDLHSNKPDKEDKGNSSNADLDSGLDGSGSDPSIAGDPEQDPVVNLHHREDGTDYTSSDGCCRDNGGGKSNETDGSGHDGGSSSSGNSEQNGEGENSQSGGRDEGSQGGASGGSDEGGGGAGGGGGGGGGGGDKHPDRRIEEKCNHRKKKKKKDQKNQADQQGESSDDEACLQSSPTGRLVHNQPATSDSVSGLSEDRPQSASSPDTSNTSSVNVGMVWTNESTQGTSEPRGSGLQPPASPLPAQRTQETMRFPIQCTEHSVEDLNPDRPVSSPPIAAECNTNSDDDHKIGGGPPIQCSEDVGQTRRAGATVVFLPPHNNSDRCQLDLVHIRPGNLFNLRPNAGLQRQCQEDVRREIWRRAVEENRRLCRRLSCQACFRYRYSYLLWPCAHLVCQDCAVVNRLCPKCRKRIEQRIGVSNAP